MKRLNHYAWSDDNDALHLDVPKMLEHMKAVTRIALEYFNRELPNIPLTVVSECAQ